MQACGAVQRVAPRAKTPFTCNVFNRVSQSLCVGEQLVARLLRVHLPLPKHNGWKLRDAHTVGVVLRLQRESPAPLVKLGLRAEALASLARDARRWVSAAEEIAGIDLHARLGRLHAQANASERRVHFHEHRQLLQGCFRRPAAEDPRVVVPTQRRHGALVNVPTKGLRFAEIQRWCVGHRGDGPGGEELRIDLDVLVTRGHRHDVLHHRRGVVDIAIQVKVRMVGQRQDGVPVRGGVVGNQPLIVFCDRVGDPQRDRAWEALLPVGGSVLECDAAAILGHDVEHPPVEALPPAVQGVEAGLVQRGAVLLAFQLERPVADSVRNTANGRSEICVLRGRAIFAGVAPTQDYIDWALPAAGESEVRQRRSIPDQCRPGRPCRVAELDGLIGAFRLGVALEIRLRRRRSPQRRRAAEAHGQHHQRNAAPH
mmetsp:Transcript_75099/g.229784  ORF Transcript_75099/g.229784 Transcript_75099/m.229784 type:complete len:427 (-) Transcript_75099:95-1375(-)